MSATKDDLNGTYESDPGPLGCGVWLCVSLVCSGLTLLLFVCEVI